MTTWPGTSKVVLGDGRLHDAVPVRVGAALLPRVVGFRFDGDSGHPDLRIRFEVRDGTPECVAVELIAKHGGRGLRTSDLGLNLAALTENTFAHVGSVVGPVAPTVDIRREVERSRRGRPRSTTRTPEFLGNVATVYRKYADTRAPTKAVAEHFGVRPRTAELYVQRAREAGLLPPSEHGKVTV